MLVKGLWFIALAGKPSLKDMLMPTKRKRSTCRPSARRGSQQQPPTPLAPTTPVSPSEQHETIEKARRRLKAAHTRQEKALVTYNSTLPSAPQFTAVTAELHEATRSLIYARAAFGETCTYI